MWIIKTGIIFSILSIAIGAFGAHALANIIAEKSDVFKTAVQYQIFHALGLILIGLIAKTLNLDLNIVAYFIICGILLFSVIIFAKACAPKAPIAIDKIEKIIPVLIIHIFFKFLLPSFSILASNLLFT